MPIHRKQQILSKVETSEGVDSVPGADDATQIFNPQITPEAEVQDRVPAGPTLSRDFQAIGRTTLELQFESDFRGSGDTSIPVAEPEWGKYLKGSGYRVSSLVKITCGAITGTGFQVGEGCVQVGPSGIIVGILVSGVPVHRTVTTGAILVVAVLSGTFTTSATAGTASGSTMTASAVAAYEGVGFQPTSQKLTNITTAAWSGGTPAAVGEILKVEQPAGTVVGAVQIINNNGSFLDMDVTQLFGTIASGNTLRNAAGTGTTTISATPTQTRTPSLTHYHNFDGRRRPLLGSRGDFVLEGDSGGPMIFRWTFRGDVGPRVDTPATTTAGLSVIRPPRLLGAFLCYGLAAEIYRLPTKRISFANGGVISDDLDGNRAGGSRGTNVTDRRPAITVTLDAVHGAFDWEGALENSTPIRAAFVLGATPGNIMSLVAPVCQVTAVTMPEQDGMHGMEVVLEPRRVAESGDDELFISQL